MRWSPCAAICLTLCAPALAQEQPVPAQAMPHVTLPLAPPPAAEQAPRASVRFAPYRYDDLLWENDRTAHRIYGPALQAHEPPSGSGIDAWGKTVAWPFMFDREGRLWADSFKLAPPSFTLGDPVAAPWPQDFARGMDRVVDFLVGARRVPEFVEPAVQDADAWPELVRAREQGRTQIELRRAPDRTPVITAAAPVGLNGATLLTTRNASDITQAVRDARTNLLIMIAFALLVSIVLSLYLARTIIEPLRRLGRAREVEVPRMQERGDEIGVLAGAVSDMRKAQRGPQARI